MNKRRTLVGVLSAVAVLLAVDIGVRLNSTANAQPVPHSAVVGVGGDSNMAYRLWSDGRVEAYQAGRFFGQGVVWEGWRPLN